MPDQSVSQLSSSVEQGRQQIYSGHTLRRSHIVIIIIAVVAHCSILFYEGTRDGPASDEIAHFAAAMEHWQHGRFDLFSVNPPLVRCVLTPFIALSGDAKLDAYQYYTAPAPGKRPEFRIGGLIAHGLGPKYFFDLSICRWMYVSFSLLGAWICYRWANELWGRLPALCAVVLWCFSPTVLAYGHIITPDLGSASVGIAAVYSFRLWLQRPTRLRICIAGLLLGLAELTKTTWLIFIPLYPVLWTIYIGIAPGNVKVRVWLRGAVDILCVFLIAWWILNLGYGFESSFQRLKDFAFISTPLGGTLQIDGPPHAGNRFIGTWAGNLPVPLPANYLIGIDYMKWEFEHKEWSYLDGNWKLGGWWYYYLFALLFKEPTGNWVLFFIALYVSAFRSSAYNRAWREELIVLIPMAVVFSFVSSQTGFDHHVRYILPVFPFAFIWIAKIAQAFTLRDYKIATMVGLAGIWSITSSLSVFPHHMSYFAEVFGGPKSGYKYLDNTNLDWGQDLHYVKDWHDRHPEARPFHFILDVPLIDPKDAGIDALPIPVGPQSTGTTLPKPEDLGPKPGWYCISIKRIECDRLHNFDYFKDLQPVEWVGYTMQIYYISLDRANALRRRYGLPPTSESSAASPTLERSPFGIDR